MMDLRLPAGPKAIEAHPLRWLWLAGALLGVVTIGVATVTGPMLPTFVDDLALSTTQLRWVAGTMVLGLAVLVVPGAVLGDLIGHARVCLLGTVGFTLASVLGAVAGTGGVLIVARLLQGFAAALVLPQVIGYARAHLPRVERGLTYGLFGLAFVAGPVLGTLLVTELVDGPGWRSVFWVVVPAGVLAAAAAVPVVFRSHPVRVDPLGLALAAAAVPAAAGIMLPLTARDFDNWPVWYLGPLVAGGLLFAGCLVLEAVRLGVRAGLGAPLVTLPAVAGGAHLTIVQLYAQVLGGQSILTIAIAGLPAAVAALVGAALAVTLARAADPRVGAPLGAVIIAAGAWFLLVSLNGGVPGIGTLAIGSGFTGFGLALVVVSVMFAEPANRPAAAPAAGFAALALGTPAGAALTELFLFRSRLTPEDGFTVLRDATGAVLGWSIGLLLLAAVIGLVLGPRRS